MITYAATCDYCGDPIPGPPAGAMAAAVTLITRDGRNFHACDRCAPVRLPAGATAPPQLRARP